LHGERQPRHQVLRCPQCGRSVFILPRSPYQIDRAREGVLLGARSRSFWVMPTLAAAATLAILSALFLAAWPYLARQQERASPGEQLGARRAAGTKALAEGAFHRGAEELAAAVRLADQQPGLLSGLELRRLRQLHRQGDLLDRLLSQSPRELLEQALAARPDEEWQARFRQDYQGKTIIFDDLVRQDEMGRPVLGSSVVQAGEVQARLAVEDLRLLQRLPLGVPRRLVFGARLAGFARELGGHWVIRFDPDSGVLFTDRDAFLACSPTLIERDPELLEVVKGQNSLLEQLAHSQ